MFFFFFFFCHCNNFFCTTWSVERSRVVSFSLFLFVIVIKKFLYHVVSWKEQISKFLRFFLCQVGQAEGNNFFFSFLFFFFNYVSYEQNVMFVMLASVGVFLVDGLKKKIIPGWKVLGVFFVVVEARVRKMLLGQRENLVYFYLTTRKWAPICLQNERWYLFLGRVFYLPQIFSFVYGFVNEVF